MLGYLLVYHRRMRVQLSPLQKHVMAGKDSMGTQTGPAALCSRDELHPEGCSLEQFTSRGNHARLLSYSIFSLFLLFSFFQCFLWGLHCLLVWVCFFLFSFFFPPEWCLFQVSHLYSWQCESHILHMFCILLDPPPPLSVSTIITCFLCSKRDYSPVVSFRIL